MICVLCAAKNPKHNIVCKYCGTPLVLFPVTVKNVVDKRYKSLLRYFCLNCLTRGLMPPNLAELDQVCPECGNRLKYHISVNTSSTKSIPIWEHEENDIDI